MVLKTGDVIGCGGSLSRVLIRLQQYCKTVALLGYHNNWNCKGASVGTSGGMGAKERCNGTGCKREAKGQTRVAKLTIIFEIF